MLKLVKERGSVSVPSSVASPMANPVEALWEIELLYGKHPDYTEYTYAVNFTTRLEGNASKCFLVINLRERFDEYLRDLNVFRALEKSEMHRVIDYVKYLKVNGHFRRVPNLLSVIEGSASTDESLELFEMVSDAILSDPDAFPTVSSDLYKHGVSSGVRLDTEQYVAKYGVTAVGVSSEALFEILDLEGSTKNVRLLEIARGWKEQGLLLKHSRQARLQEPVKPNNSSKEVNRFYILKIDALAHE
jgi:hypothetical protein